MKKNQPSPFSSPSIQELIQLYEQAAAEVHNAENLSPPSPLASEKSTHKTKDEAQKQSVESTPTKAEAIYASVTSKPTSPLMQDRPSERKQNPQARHTTIASAKTKSSPHHQEEEASLSFFAAEQIFTTTAASSSADITLSEQEVKQLLPYNRLVKAYYEEAQRFCQTVYGNPHILQEQLEAIQQNASLAEELSLQLAATPQGVHKFAGRKIFGIKSGPRKTAEENFPTLCGIVECYGQAVKFARESLSQSPTEELKNYEQFMGREMMCQILPRAYSSQEDRAPLANDEIFDMVRNHPMVKKYHAQIEYWCGVVFGKSDILQAQTGQFFVIPETAEHLSLQLAQQPQSLHSYAGVNIGGLKNKARRHAEAGLSHLISAVENYAETIKCLKEGILQTQQVPSELSVRLSQDLSQSSQMSENLSAIPHHETAQFAKHRPERAQDAQSRKAAFSKAMAFAS